MKSFLLLVCLLVITANSIKWDQVTIPTSTRGKYSQNQKYWTGGLYECDSQCKERGGYVCGGS